MKLWVKIALWSIFVIGLISTGVLINTKLSEQIVPKPEIVIHADGEDIFITNEELLDSLYFRKLFHDELKRENLNIGAIEAYISGISQVKSVEVYHALNGQWKIDVSIRKPIARIFNLYGESFYLDSEGNTFNKTSRHVARTLVFTGEITDRKNSVSTTKIINNDSLISIRKLDDIYRISDYVCNDPLFHSLIGQVHLKKNGDFILVPLVGDQKIIFGSAYSREEVEEKFKKLKIFYKEALPYEGWNTYSEISLKFDDQIVCKKKETDE